MDLSKYRQKLIGSEDERAVSPVIGVILMVAITVILAAVIAAFVLDIGDLDDSAPNANFDYELSDDGEDIISISHDGGDEVNMNAITVDTDEQDDVVITTGDWDEDEISAGDTLDFEDGDVDDDDGNEINSVNEVTVIWESDGSSQVLFDEEV